MAETNDKFIIVGKFGSQHGVQGWIKVQPLTRPTQAIINYKPWYMETNGGWQEIELEDIQPHGKTFIAHLKNINDPETARLYTNKAIAIKRTQLPKLEKDEYYWTDLEGLSVTNQQGVELGKIDSLFETGSNDVMVVIGEKRHLIPLLMKEIVIKIDLDNKTMLVDWDVEF